MLLQDKIKTLRKKNSKRGDDLSRQLEKGAAYISQIENGKIKEIEFDTLIQIFQLILNLSGTAFNNYMRNYIENILMDITKDDLIKEYWIHLFVVQEIQYPVTDFIREFISKKLSEHNKTPQELTSKINMNYQLNDIYPYTTDHYIPNKAYVNALCTGTYNDEEYSLTVWVHYDLERDFISKSCQKQPLL